MNASTLTIHWHNDTQPVYSVEFQPCLKGREFSRLITAGGDNNVRAWRLGDDGLSVEYLSTLRKHTQAVNAARFNPEGSLLASAGDDGTIMLWKLSPTILRDLEQDEDVEDLESWACVAQLRSSTSEINDICWCPKGRYILAGSMDNTARIYEVTFAEGKYGGKLVTTLTDHTHYVQGVTWDPLGEFFATQSADRSVVVYKASDYSLLHRFSKINNSFIYYSETLQSFFRRLSFSPDGMFLITPAGLDTSTVQSSKSCPSKPENPNSDISNAESASAAASTNSDSTISCSTEAINKVPVAPSEEPDNTCYVFIRQGLASTPLLKLGGLSKPATVVSFSPIKYKATKTSLVDSPYKMIFAVATLDAVVLYSTDKFEPVGYVSNLHYSAITDIRWDSDGSRAVVSSTDGFCSVISFEEGVFGEVYEETKLPDIISTTSSSEVRLPEDIESNQMKDIEVNETVKNNDKMDVDVPEPQSQHTHLVPEKTIDAFFKKDNKQKKRITPTLISN